MFKVYLVFIKMGFEGVKTFHSESNAQRFASSIGETVDTESATAQEYFSTDFADGYSADMIETPSVQFNII